ncbi:MAG: hypothetical protein IJQ07_05745 [Clostridia bacterium]|nr:hypothetical protein [Clostridia bacterium]
MKNIKTLDIIVPIIFDGEDLSEEQIIQNIIFQNQQFGFTKFIFRAPEGRWRSKMFCPEKVWIKLAESFVRIKNRVVSYGVECGWIVGTTIKSGRDKRFQPIIMLDGTEAPFSNCPYDESFRNQFAKNVATFAKIAQPAFIMFEDDFSVKASSRYGCFCENHLKELAKRCGRYYSREELMAELSKNTENAYNLKIKLAETIKDSLIVFAKSVRTAVDKENPEIPMGIWKSGALYMDGDPFEEISIIMAGKLHSPIARLNGAFYCGGNSKDIPSQLYDVLYTNEHMVKDFKAYQESDTYPHTRFYNSGLQLGAMLGVGISWGCAGAVYSSHGFLDDYKEETVYGEMFHKESIRWNIIADLVKKCDIQGVQIGFNPLLNAVVSEQNPQWTSCIGRFGIPFTTKKSTVQCWDITQAKYANDKEVIDALSQGLLLDGDAAKALCERGYGKYLGVSVGDDITKGSKLAYDLLAREIICDKFALPNKGKRMHSAFMYSPVGNGKMLKLTLTDKKCEVVSENYSGFGEYISPAMTRFQNNLGGRVVVMGLTLEGNKSPALFNYGRQGLLHSLIRWCGGDYVFSENNPDVFTIVNVPKDKKNADFKALITLTLLDEDSLKNICLHLPAEMRSYCIRTLTENGTWKTCKQSCTGEGVLIEERLDYLKTTFLMITNRKQSMDRTILTGAIH